jgi:hypothetical protein
VTKDAFSAFVTDTISTHKSAVRYDITHAFPLLIHGAENYRTEFRDFLFERYGLHYSSEELFGYIYAALNAPAYRRRFAAFLPFAPDTTGFERLSALGWSLVQAHLMRDLPATGQGILRGQGSNRVEQVTWLESERAVRINDAQMLGPIDPAVWQMQIGGYQVLDKYLKARKGRRHFSPDGPGAGPDFPLSLDEINQIERICDALAFTLEQMGRIDAAWADIFPGYV